MLVKVLNYRKFFILPELKTVFKFCYSPLVFSPFPGKNQLNPLKIRPAKKRVLHPVKAILNQPLD